MLLVIARGKSYYEDFWEKQGLARQSPVGEFLGYNNKLRFTCRNLYRFWMPFLRPSRDINFRVVIENIRQYPRKK